ncbi:IS1096 element passenger TnpR family protein [Lentibacillus salinarum]|uniref:Plasmid pRiA4b Orf3-like domain-containing protein n=1 Tax=Lentibacillus salinarum TaxID=446820 RepID=A0ABW3ZUJ3_9BACI
MERRFIIPGETTFKRLHDTIQFVMGWQESEKELKIKESQSAS